VILPTDDNEDAWVVYLLPGTTQRGIVPAGGTYSDWSSEESHENDVPGWQPVSFLIPRGKRGLYHRSPGSLCVVAVERSFGDVAGGSQRRSPLRLCHRIEGVPWAAYGQSPT
jgi:hypothetical protein